MPPSGRSPATAEVDALRADVDALTGELLDRYEEITLLYDLARDMGAVLDLEEASRTALARSLKVISADLGLILIGDDPHEMRIVATYGQTGQDDSRLYLARSLAEGVLRSGVQLMLAAGDSAGQGGRPVAEPVLLAPLTPTDTAPSEQRFAGVLAFVGHGMSERFSAAEAQLSAVVASQLGQGIENARLISQLREKERLETDLRTAARIQRSLLPERPPSLQGASCAAVCIPAAHVGGDYFDFVTDADGAVTIIVADVTGHGLGPGLIMAMTRSVLRAELRRSESLTQGLQETNSVMWDDLLATEAFITVFVARYEPRLRRLCFVNAGHQPALLRRADGTIEELLSGGMPLGIVPSPAYEENSRQLQPGDVVLIISDGVVETFSPDNVPLGTDGLQHLVAAAKAASADDITSLVVSRVTDVRGAGAQDDDITVVALRVNESREGRSA